MNPLDSIQPYQGLVTLAVVLLLVILFVVCYVMAKVRTLLHLASPSKQVEANTKAISTKEEVIPGADGHKGEFKEQILAILKGGKYSAHGIATILKVPDKELYIHLAGLKSRHLINKMADGRWELVRAKR